LEERGAGDKNTPVDPEVGGARIIRAQDDVRVGRVEDGVWGGRGEHRIGLFKGVDKQLDLDLGALVRFDRA
jgi:hypothetical protein